MYTQCPNCQTVFHITMETLKVHDGVVRCGRCDNVFNADQQLFSDIPQSKTEKKPLPKKARTEKTKPAKIKTATPAKPPQTLTKVVAKSDPATEEVDAAPAPWSPPPAPVATKQMEPEAVDDRLRYSPAPVSPRHLSVLWIVGIAASAMMLLAQSVYFYRDQLAAYPELRPYLLEMCAQLECRVQPPYDASRIELIQPTNIAPHPRIANALRLRATLVNRANLVQPHPFMQITLTDNAGRVLARRVFSPQQYLEQRAAAQNDMAPHLAISALIDLTNPDGKAVGYQIDFLPPPPS